MTENGFLIIFCGLPSSGKTTTAQNLKIKLEENYKNNISIIDTDILRIQKYGNEFTPDNEIKIIESALIQVRDLLLQGHIVLSDDINYFESMRHEFVQIAQE
jgi:tRNA uridine 5-carbamoylmethylation protein Kti12